MSDNQLDRIYGNGEGVLLVRPGSDGRDWLIVYCWSSTIVGRRSTREKALDHAHEYAHYQGDDDWQILVEHDPEDPDE